MQPQAYGVYSHPEVIGLAFNIRLRSFHSVSAILQKPLEHVKLNLGVLLPSRSLQSSERRQKGKLFFIPQCLSAVMEESYW